MTWSCVSNTRECIGNKVWEVAVAMDPLNLCTWDTIGCLHRRQERPYFTESSVDCVQKVCRVRTGRMAVHMNTSMADCLLWKVLSRKQLIWDLKLLLIGLPSQTFQYNQVWPKETVIIVCLQDFCLPLPKGYGSSLPCTERGWWICGHNICRYGQVLCGWWGVPCVCGNKGVKTSSDFKELDVGGIMQEVYGSCSLSLLLLSLFFFFF